MSLCPCTSGKEYADCCRPYIEGELKAPTAEALMRSRYTAFATQAIDHLRETLKPGTRGDFDEASVRQWSESAEWTGLDVVSASGGGENYTAGKIHFIARYSVKNTPQEFEEVGSFEKIDDTWYYVDGEVKGHTPYRRETPKVGRNEPCPCGSGKKFKKCCA